MAPLRFGQLLAPCERNTRWRGAATRKRAMTLTREGTVDRSTMQDSAAALTLLSSKWALPVLVALADGPARRKHLKRRAAPINDDRLDAALSHHLRDGLVADAWIPGPRRNERGYALTDAGERLLLHAETMESSAARMQGEIAGEKFALSGTVRIGAPDGFGAFFMTHNSGHFTFVSPSTVSIHNHGNMYRELV